MDKKQKAPCWVLFVLVPEAGGEPKLVALLPQYQMHRVKRKRFASKIKCLTPTFDFSAGFPIRYRKTKSTLLGAFCFGAGSGGRTRTVSLPPDFESGTSANSIIPANLFDYKIISQKNQLVNTFLK